MSTDEDVINDVGIDCEIGSIPILILFAFSASFSHALASSCSARTLVRCGGVGRCKEDDRLIIVTTTPAGNTYIVCVKSSLLPGPLGPATRLQVGSDALACSLRELGELTGTGVDDGLDLLLRLLGYWYVAVQIFIHEQTNKHLKSENDNLVENEKPQ